LREELADKDEIINMNREKVT